MTGIDLRTHIAAVLLTHQHVNGKCLCQSLREQTTSGQHAKHMADAVLAELGLTREWEESRPDPEILTGRYRYVTEWHTYETQ